MGEGLLTADGPNKVVATEFGCSGRNDHFSDICFGLEMAQHVTATMTFDEFGVPSFGNDDFATLNVDASDATVASG